MLIQKMIIMHWGFSAKSLKNIQIPLTQNLTHSSDHEDLTSATMVGMK